MENITGHVDSFSRDNLPGQEQQPEYIFDLPALTFPAFLNCANELLDNKIHQGLGNKTAILSPHVSWTYQELFSRANQIAHVLTDEMGLIPGNRVLLRAPNNPMLAACWLAVLKTGGVVVATMPLLRCQDLEPVINKAEIEFALWAERLIDELQQAQQLTSSLNKIVLFNADGNTNANTELEQQMQDKPTDFKNIETASDDVALIAFTSGTTGQPKGTIHFHRDVMSMCVCVGDELVKPTADDIFIGSPPLAFTFGLGMQLALPLYAGATTVLIENPTPPKLTAAIEEYKATICATAPTAYRAMLDHIGNSDISSLKKTVSAGEHLPLATYEKWQQATGIKMIDGLGATEMIHIFLSSADEDIRPGAIGKAVSGYKVCILDDDDQVLAPGKMGHLAVKGPTGCKYLADERQKSYVKNGWNITGDICEMDEDGYIWYMGRADDMIISAGYNISGPEVEAAMISHESITECAVVASPDPERGNIVKGFVVLNDGFDGTEKLILELQEHVKQTIAPYKYPRAIEFISQLPKTQTGKIQRHKLRESEAIKM